MDVGVYGPLENAYHSLVHNYLKQHPGQVINRYNITSLICQSYIKASTPSNIVSSFSKTGIFPFNPDVIDPVHFMPSKITHPTNDDHTLGNEGSTDNPEPDINVILESYIPKVKVSQASKKRRRDPVGEALTEGNAYLDLKERKMPKKLLGTSTAPSGPKVVEHTEEEDVIVLPQVSKSGRRIVSKTPWSPQAGPSRCIYNTVIQQTIPFVCTISDDSPISPCKKKTPKIDCSNFIAILTNCHM